MEKIKLFMLLYFMMITPSYCSDRYFLCGPDEDGCYPDIYQYCACIPYNDWEASSPYCLDFDKLTCTPLSQTTHCDPGLIFKNQGECLATIFQSEPRPPCKITTHQFCIENHTPICDKTGQPKSCH
ncbi:hypothetical protein LEAN103870_11625 [Legionella anisa]|uniref:Uncharacterized protein n=1 Tax=Legionella anisa TaxID=28082 RepID=A0AAX0WX44_9GAMM|nr:hypothetical protein [Legionella anisa]KTC72205.1 hypothetical protein Lani_1339 [Legionella anisa]PNL63051.1 hypothetical protein A6J39_018620 [Legionella anisa]UAK78208.1 hypothetical protein K8O89_10885 [Legionella anisa]